MVGGFCGLRLVFLGEIVGILVGAVEGDIEGTALGAIDGILVGAVEDFEGLRKGNFWGLHVGAVEGTLLGAIDGILVGAVEGTSLGGIVLGTESRNWILICQGDHYQIDESNMFVSCSPWHRVASTLTE